MIKVRVAGVKAAAEWAKSFKMFGKLIRRCNILCHCLGVRSKKWPLQKVYSQIPEDINIADNMAGHIAMLATKCVVHVQTAGRKWIGLRTLRASFAACRALFAACRASFAACRAAFSAERAAF